MKDRMTHPPVLRPRATPSPIGPSLRLAPLLVGLALGGGVLSGCSSSGDSNGLATGSGGASAAQGTGGGSTIAATGGATQTGSGTGGLAAAPGTGGALGSSGGAGAGGSGTDSTATGGASDSGGSASGGSVGGRNGQGASGGATATGGRAMGGDGNANANGGTTGAGGANHTGVWKVMPFGDSVTGSTCYPQVLSKVLIAGGHTNFQFIGTVTNNCGNGTPSVKTEGHGGYGATYLPMDSMRPKCTKQPQGCGSYAELQAWAAEKPDMVLMHYATNDCWDGEPTALILSSWQAILAEFRKQNPNVIFFISKIIPLAPAPQNAMALNAMVTPAWAAANATPTSPVYIIDHWTGFDDATDTVDGVHPNASGAMKMATASYNALVAAGYF